MKVTVTGRGEDTRAVSTIEADKVVVMPSRAKMRWKRFAIVNTEEQEFVLQLSPSACKLWLWLVFQIGYSMSAHLTLRGVCDGTGMSMNTVRRAAEELENAGGLRRHRGSDGQAYWWHLDPRRVYRGRAVHYKDAVEEWVRSEAPGA